MRRLKLLVKKYVNNISEAIESMESYDYQYNIKLVGFSELHEHESAIETTNLCLEIFKAISARGLTSQDIDIAHRVKSRRDIRPKPIIAASNRGERAATLIWTCVTFGREGLHTYIALSILNFS